MKTSITAIILTKNEEKNIVDCIDSLSFCDEILIIDDESTDKTPDIVASIKDPRITLFTNTLDNNFSKQRNFGLSKSHGDWTLFIDADERVTAPLTNEIQQAVLSSEVDGYAIIRQDTMWGKRLSFGEWGSTSFVRLARKGKSRWHGAIHEVLAINGKTATLVNYLHHYPHQTISEFLEELDFYTTIRAKELFDKNITVSGLTILFFTVAKFVQNFFIKRGYKDGMPGLLLSIFMSFHSFLVRGKLWQLQNTKQK